jgi:hypothetical protein
MRIIMNRFINDACSNYSADLISVKRELMLDNLAIQARGLHRPLFSARSTDPAAGHLLPTPMGRILRGTMAYRHGNHAEGNLPDLSPDYTDADVGRIWDGNGFGER